MLIRLLTTRTVRTLLFSVLTALVFAQTLGALHRVVHAQRAAGTGHTQQARAQVTAFDALFAGHDSEQACDQYDQLNHADLATGVHAVVVPATLVDVPVTVHPGWQIAAQAAGFLARGPPAQA